MKRPAVVLIVTTVAAALVGTMVYLSSRNAEQQRAARAYEHAIEPLVNQGGQVVVEGIRPRLSDVVAGTITRERFTTEAQQWVSQLSSIESRVKRISAPERLAPSKRLLLLALDGYISATQAFSDAVAQAADPTHPALDKGIRLAQRADKTYDQAHGLLVKELKRLGG